jgi:hypothetical protein
MASTLDRSKKYRLLYGMHWPIEWHPCEIEMECIRRGGRWKKAKGEIVGEGLFYHHKRLQQILDPAKVWHKWNELLLKCFIENRIIGIMGPASSGKTRESGDFARMCYYIWPHETTIIVTSTEKETLEDRVWGEIKSGHKAARRIYPDLPGHLIESRQRLLTDDREETGEEGRDTRNGIVGVPCKKGGSYQGLSAFAGRKNKRVMLIADEASLMPRVFVDAISNLNKNRNFKAIVLGNPKETTDALGIVCEPSAELGGWDSSIDQAPKTKTWAIRFPQGICVQLVGSDSPNLDGKLGIPLINQEQIDADIQFYGKDSLQFTMMDEGRMPRGQGSRRVITRQMCHKFHAMEEPIWDGDQKTKIFFLDAAYGRVGGDRCVGGELNFGRGLDINKNKIQILSLIETMLVPVSVSLPEMPEDQIVDFTMKQCVSRGIPPENVFFDSTGRGSLMSAFGRLWSTAVNGVEFGGVASDRQVSSQIEMTCKEYYFNKVSELWYEVRRIIEAGQFRGMTEEVMMEGCQREWGITNRRIQVEPKDDMKVKSGRSPDLFDAVAAGVFGAFRLGFSIQGFRLAGKGGNSIWKNELKKRMEKIRARYELNYSA